MSNTIFLHKICFFRHVSKTQKCDMIKGNESDEENIDFELQASKGDKFLGLTLVFNFQKLLISLQPDV